MRNYLHIISIMDWYGRVQLIEIGIYFLLLIVFVARLIHGINIKNIYRLKWALLIIVYFTIQNMNYIPAIFDWYLAGLETVAKNSDIAWASEIRYIFNEHMTSIFGIIAISIFNFNKNYFK